MTDEKKQSEDEWRSKLTPEQYRVAREKGTERAFTGKYHDDKNPGIYKCVCCGAPLFGSGTKFDSGTGWPSFTAPLNDSSVKMETDTSHGMLRTEVACRACNAHLGHVFPDGPGPAGQRFCINSASLNKEDK